MPSDAFEVHEPEGGNQLDDGSQSDEGYGGDTGDEYDGNESDDGDLEDFNEEYLAIPLDTELEKQYLIWDPRRLQALRNRA